MPVDGTYAVEMDTPLGAQTASLTLKAEGGVLSGSVASPLGSREFGDGSVNGDDFSWGARIESPLGEMDIEFNGRVTGDAIAGDVTAGSLGTFSFKGKRV
jgi:hypothetical protein